MTTTADDGRNANRGVILMPGRTVIANAVLTDLVFRPEPGGAEISIVGCNLRSCDLTELRWENLRGCWIVACDLPPDAPIAEGPETSGGYNYVQVHHTTGRHQRGVNDPRPLTVAWVPDRRKGLFERFKDWWRGSAPADIEEDNDGD